LNVDRFVWGDVQEREELFQRKAGEFAQEGVPYTVRGPDERVTSPDAMEMEPGTAIVLAGQSGEMVVPSTINMSAGVVDPPTSSQINDMVR